MVRQKHKLYCLETWVVLKSTRLRITDSKPTDNLHDISRFPKQLSWQRTTLHRNGSVIPGICTTEALPIYWTAFLKNDISMCNKISAQFICKGSQKKRACIQLINSMITRVSKYSNSSILCHSVITGNAFDRECTLWTLMTSTCS